MAQDATKIFAGPATKIELSANGSTYTDIGYGNAEAEITWEPNSAELMDSNVLQLSGLGKIKVVLVQTDSTTLTAVQAYRAAKAYVRITDVNNRTWQVSGIFLQAQMARGFKPGEPHTLEVTGQRQTIDQDDWCAFPA